MGSDLYMEEQSFRPRPTKATWEWREDAGDHVLVIEQDVFYHGYKIVWEGQPNEHNIDLLEIFVGRGNIPEKPEPVKSLREKIDEEVYKFFGYMDSGLTARIIKVVEEHND
jgi:hypothetical protein